MRASLDTNVIIHFYRANLQAILLEYFEDGVFIYEQIRNIELENHAEDLLDVIEMLCDWKDLSKSHKVFQIPLKASINNTKNMYGAKQALERIPLSIRLKAPWYLKTNISVPVLYFKKNTIILFPEKVLIVGNIKAGAINQKEIELDFFENGFVENDFTPKDSEFIQYQWIHPNKNGEPDRRFKNNRQLPVYNYGFIDITSSNGLNQRIMVTNNKICMRLSEFYKEFMKTFSF